MTVHTIKNVDKIDKLYLNIFFLHKTVSQAVRLQTDSCSMRYAKTLPFS